MKKANERKLSLKKETISSLDPEKMRKSSGGDTITATMSLHAWVCTIRCE